MSRLSISLLAAIAAGIALHISAIPLPLCAAEIEPLMIYGASISEQRAAVIRFSNKNGKPALEVVQSEPLGARASAITYHPDHRLIYSGAKDGSGFVFRVEADGSMKKIRKWQFKSGYCFLTVDRTGHFLLGASYESGNVDAYRLDKQGLPERLTDSRNVKNARGINKTMAHSVGVSLDNRSVYIPFVKEENALCQFHFDAKTGRLTPQEPFQVKVSAAVGPRHVVTHPTRPFVYFSNEQQLGVSVYRVNDRGGLEGLQLVNAIKTLPAQGLAGSDIVITPDGRFLFVGVRGFGKPLNAVFGYAIQSDGRLKQLGMTKTDSIPWALGMSPRGDRLFVSASKSGTLTAYAIDSQGTLKKEAAVDLGKNFWDILVLAPDKKIRDPKARRK